MKKEVKQALQKITSYNDKYNLNGDNKLTACLNHFDKTVKDGVIIDDAGITVRCPYYDGKNICIYENCPAYSDYLKYLAMREKIGYKQNKTKAM